MRSQPHPYLSAGPIAIAHRGGAEEAPENTFAAFSGSVALGYTYLETDVHVTRDGVVVAFHDQRLDRVTDKAGLISDLTIDDVESADAGYWFTPDDGTTFPYRGKGERVPRLRDLMTQFPSARFNIDPKHDATVLPLLKVVASLNAYDRVCIGSFSDRRLASIRRLSGGRACTSMGPGKAAVVRAGSWLGLPAPRLGADCLQLPLSSGGVSFVDEKMITSCHRRGLPVHVWTVNDVHQMHRLLDLGVDGIMTDRPRQLASIFAQRSLSLSGI